MLELANTLTELLPVIAGAAIALAGSIATTMLQAIAQKKAVSQSKLETLVKESYQVWEWQRKCAIAQGLIQPFPVGKMHTIATIYWPKHQEIDDLVGALALATQSYQEYWEKHQNKDLFSGDHQSKLKELEAQIYSAQWDIVKIVRALTKKS